MDEITKLSIHQILGLSVTAGIVTFLLNLLHTSFKDARSKSTENKHSALRIALALEKFSIACAEAITNEKIFRTSGGGHGSFIETLPILVLPSDIQLKGLSSAQINRVLSFENTVLYGNGAISFESSYNDPDEDCVQGRMQAGYCGHLAVMLAQELRIAHSLPAPELPSRWDYRKILKRCYDEHRAWYIHLSE